MTVPKTFKTGLLAGLLLLFASGAQALSVGRLDLSDSGGRRILHVATQGQAQPRLETLPKKLLIVIPDGQRAMRTLRVGTALLKQIRFGKNGKDLRVVLDLNEDVSATLGSVTAAGFNVDLGPAQGTVKAKASEASDEALSPAAAGYTYSVVDLALSGDDGHSGLVITANGPASYKPSVRENAV